MNNTEKTTIFVQDKLPKFLNYKVYKHNDLIQCKSNFSAMEHRIIVLALAQIQKQDENLKMYRIYIQDVLGKKYGKKEQIYNNYNTVRNAVKKLHKSTIDMEEGKKWRSYSFITKAQGEYGTNFIEIQFHEDIQKFLLGLKSQYTTYTLENVMKFKKNYSLRIYELCKQYVKIGNRTMKMDYLRTLFCLENKYKNYPDFRDRVLKPAIEEINKHSDIQVDFSENRERRKVEKIIFSIKPQKGVTAQENKTLAEMSLEVEHKEKFLSLGFDADEIFELREHYSEDRLSTVLDLFEKNIDIIKFPKPWILKALKANFVDSTEFKKQFSIEDKIQKKELEEREKKKIQLLEISEKKIEKMHIKDKMEIIENNIQYYREINELKPGDVMRFPKDFSVENAIEYSQNQFSQLNLQLINIQKNLDILNLDN